MLCFCNRPQRRIQQHQPPPSILSQRLCVLLKSAILLLTLAASRTRVWGFVIIPSGQSRIQAQSRPNVLRQIQDTATAATKTSVRNNNNNMGNIFCPPSSSSSSSSSKDGKHPLIGIKIDNVFVKSHDSKHHLKNKKKSKKKVAAANEDNNNTDLPKQQQEEREREEAWKAVCQDYTKQLLDDSFLTLPVRASTVEAAALYPTTTTQKSLMPGTHKHLGGAYDPVDGCIYGVPANSRSVMCLCPVYHEDVGAVQDKGDGANGSSSSPASTTKTVKEYQLTTIPLPAWVADYRMKWLRGIFAHGYMWAIPSWAPAVLCVDIDAWRGRRPLAEGKTGYVDLLPLPPQHQISSWQWHGAGINHEKTAIYCIPSNAQQVLKVDLITKGTSLIPIDVSPQDYPHFDIQMPNKWYGGIVGHDNCVYGIPYRSCAVLQINMNTDTATIIGKEYETAQYNWHGGIQVNGKIYAHPSHAETVLVIDTTTTRPPDQPQCYELPIHRALYDTDPRKNYKWLGGAVGVDGNIYCPACDTSAVLKIDTKTETCTTFGFCGTQRNKWQGGVLGRDGCVYCIPANGLHVLRISTNPQYEHVVQLLGIGGSSNTSSLPLPAHKDKWQGGSQGKDGSLYFIPENGYRVLKITPPPEPPAVVNGKLPDHDVKVEFL